MDADCTTDLLATRGVPNSQAVALRLLGQTRSGRRQWATAQALAAAGGPLPPPQLIAAVVARAGHRGYGTQPGYTLPTH